MSVLHLGSSQPTYRLTLTPVSHTAVWHTIVCHGVPHCSVWHTTMVLPTSQADTRARPHQEGNSPLPQAKNPDPDLALHLPTFVTRVTCLSPVTYFSGTFVTPWKYRKLTFSSQAAEPFERVGDRGGEAMIVNFTIFPSEAQAWLRVVS